MEDLNFYIKKLKQHFAKIGKFDLNRLSNEELLDIYNKFMNDYLVDLNILGKHQKNFYCSFTKWCVGVAKETQDEQLITPENRVSLATQGSFPAQRLIA